VGLIQKSDESKITSRRIELQAQRRRVADPLGFKGSEFWLHFFSMANKLHSPANDANCVSKPLKGWPTRPTLSVQPVFKIMLVDRDG